MLRGVNLFPCTMLLPSRSSPVSETIPIAFLSWVEDDLIGEGIRFTRCNRRNLILITVDNVDDFHGSLVQRALHGLPDFCALYSIDQLLVLGPRPNGLPLSVLGFAMDTSSSHSSQQTSSSVPLPISQVAFRLRFSKKRRAIWPLVPPLGLCEEVS